MIGVDYGFGYYYNYDLAQTFGDTKVAPIYYSDNAKLKVSWDSKARNLIVNKRMFLEDVFQLLKRGDIIFPRAEEFMTPFGEDILNEYVEETRTATKVRFTHSAGRPDDSLHALAYGIMAAQFLRPRDDIFKPSEFGKERMMAR